MDCSIYSNVIEIDAEKANLDYVENILRLKQEPYIGNTIQKVMKMLVWAHAGYVQMPGQYAQLAKAYQLSVAKRTTLDMDWALVDLMQLIDSDPIVTPKVAWKVQQIYRRIAVGDLIHPTKHQFDAMYEFLKTMNCWTKTLHLYWDDELIEPWLLGQATAVNCNTFDLCELYPMSLKKHLHVDTVQPLYKTDWTVDERVRCKFGIYYRSIICEHMTRKSSLRFFVSTEGSSAREVVRQLSALIPCKIKLWYASDVSDKAGFMIMKDNAIVNEYHKPLERLPDGTIVGPKAVTSTVEPYGYQGSFPF